MIKEKLKEYKRLLNIGNIKSKEFLTLQDLNNQRYKKAVGQHINRFEKPHFCKVY